MTACLGPTSLGRRQILLGGGAALLLGARARPGTAQWFVPSRHPDEMRAGRDCLIIADRRMFAVLAFMNASGFDEQATGTPMHPVRLRVRALLAANLARRPALLARCRAFYAAAALSNADYMEYAITLGADYPFRKVGPNDGIFHDYTVPRLTGFTALLNLFWREADLAGIWNAVKGDYLAELGRYDLGRLTGDLDYVWAWTRMPRREGRIMVCVPNLLDRHYSAISVACGRYFVSVEGPGSGDYGLNIHEYLHEIVNPEVRRNYQAFQGRLDPYFAAWRARPDARGYDAPTAFVQECLVRAADARIVGRLYPARREAKRAEVVRAAADGLSLSLPFYQGLAAYEAAALPFDLYVPRLLGAVPELAA